MAIGRYAFSVRWDKLCGMSAVTSSPTRGRVVLVILLLSTLFLGFRVIRPYLNPILLAIILGSLLHPVCGWLRRRLGGRRSLAALLSLLLVVVAILGPLALVGIALVSQGMESVEGIQTWVRDGNLDRLLQQPWAERFASFTNRYFPLVDPQRLDVKALILGASQKLGALLLAKGGAILSGTGAILGQFLLFLFVLFYVFKDGEEMLTSFRRLFPLRASQEEMLLARIKGVSRSAILGAFGTAAAQGIVGGIGLAICGLPGLFWGTIMAFASLIPLIGTTLVWGPACVFLAFTGHPGMAVFLAVWCGIGVGSIDNFLRPLLMKGEAEMSTLWIFFSVLGGMQLFGLPGLVYGPLIFGLGAVLLSLYESEFHDFLEEQART
ncbi:MAG: AI-2E family transporter [Thermoanaerobaculaceae bacterium]|jgi:predicted PurR-regulated permease PerM|nr:AI-2E family transporter [Thermoanaerobaculaceae bacterium]